MTVGDLAVKNQVFAESTKEPGTFKPEIGLAFIAGQFDGIFGLAYDRISVSGVVPPFYQMVSQKLVDEPFFGCYMGDVNQGDGEGELTFGYVNPEHYNGEIHW